VAAHGSSTTTKTAERLRSLIHSAISVLLATSTAIAEHGAGHTVSGDFTARERATLLEWMHHGGSGSGFVAPAEATQETVAPGAVAAPCIWEPSTEDVSDIVPKAPCTSEATVAPHGSRSILSRLLGFRRHIRAPDYSSPSIAGLPSAYCRFKICFVGDGASGKTCLLV